MKPSIKIRDMGPADEYFVATCTHTHESDEIDACARRRLAWLRNMPDKGFRVMIATLDGQQTGFLHVIPIELSPWGPLGHDLLVIPCLVSVNKGYGVGKALLTAAEEEARRQRRKGVVTIGYYHKHWFMPATFFEASGFLSCPSVRKADFDVRHKATALWKVFDKRTEAPMLLEPKYEFKPVPGKVVIDLLWNTFCQTSDVEARRVKEVAASSEMPWCSTNTAQTTGRPFCNIRYPAASPSTGARLFGAMKHLRTASGKLLFRLYQDRSATFSLCTQLTLVLGHNATACLWIGACRSSSSYTRRYNCSEVPVGCS